MSLSISVRELNIKLYTNRQNDLDKSDLFTSSNYMPEYTGEFSKLPYFTLDIYYPNELNKLDMADRKQFFFNKDFFISKLTELVPNFKKNNFMLEGLAGKSPTEIKEYYVKRDERIDHNVSKTIELLFPTKEPIINDNHTSFDYIKNNKYKHNFWIDPWNTNSSYLQFGSSIYTVSKTVWLNDIVNHPDYRKMIMDYIEFYKWVDERANGLTGVNRTYTNEKKTIENNIESKFEVFKQKFLEFKKPINASTPVSLEIQYKALHDIIEGVTNSNDSFEIKFKEFLSWPSNNIDPPLVTGPAPVRFEWLNKIAGIIQQVNAGTKNTKQFNTKANSKGESPEITEMLKITHELRALFDQYNNHVNSKNKYLEYLKKPLNELKETDRSIAAFKISMRKLSILMTSSNVNLQDLIANTYESKSNIDAEQFYNLMYEIHTQFIEKDKNINNMDLLNIGLTTIPKTDEDSYEIALMVNLIQGKLDSSNKSKIYCQQKGEFLGNLLENIIEGKGTRTDLLRSPDRNLYSITDQGTGSNYSEALKHNAQPAQTTQTAQNVQTAQNAQTVQLNINEEELRRGLTDSNKISNELDIISKSYSNNNIDRNNIVATLKYFDKMYGVIELFKLLNEWKKANITYKNTELLKKLSAAISLINGRNEQIQIDINVLNENILNGKELEKKQHLNLENDINNKILKPILEQLIQTENKKLSQNITGGNKTRRSKHKKHIRKSIRKTKRRIRVKK